VIEDPDLAAGLRRAGLEAVQAYSWDRVRLRLIGIYEACRRPTAQRASGTGVAPKRE
jgi:glycosyltransferase involved in cell wall biosynthesis